MLRLRSKVVGRMTHRWLSAGNNDPPEKDREEQLLTLGTRPVKFEPTREISETPEQEVLYRGVDILLQAHSPNILDSFGEFIKLAATELGVDFDGFTDPLLHQDKWRVNKAPFIYGKHKIEYCARTYKKVVSPVLFVCFTIFLQLHFLFFARKSLLFYTKKMEILA